ncbi:hypothetical protein DL89DRAFT_291187 [Linderina pennispora]|uniref:NAD(P)-binding protein n=1 Tax=Linderina pennispora TaxID=61395 RepID=A0A1Y1WEF3_9FUNG|nr:uncharacterized protein DL89DRAFT_291187 [Linderina pennispora]ORX71910.1 hypothetical protein DL89DRAFT_291187 [Linderina pennispora]
MKVVIGVCVVGVARTASALTELQSSSSQFIGDRAVGVARSLGDIVGIVNNAAIVSGSASSEINLLAPLALTTKSIEDLKRNKGNVINVTSSTSQAPVPAFGPYGVTKVSLNYVSKAISVEYPEITCLAFYPGGSGNGGDMSGATKKLAHPISADLPGRIIANLALRASHELTGQYYVYSDSAMAPYST